MKFELDLSMSQIDKSIFKKNKYLNKFKELNKSLRDGSLPMTAWVDYPSLNKKSIEEVKLIASKVIKNADVLIVLGIGGSYLGALAGITALAKKPKIKVEFAGLNFSYEELEETFEKYKDKNIYVNVISKSGTTTETMMAFEYASKFLKSKYKNEYKKHMIITTDKIYGYLKFFADKNGIDTLEVPDNIGGRYSVLSPVGLLPFVCAGINIDKLFAGAALAQKELTVSDETNLAYQYALTRFLLSQKGKSVEILSSFFPRLSKIGSWWTQLFAESEGKNGKGLFVTSLDYSTDLHSVGQFVQSGTPLLFETILTTNNPPKDKKIGLLSNDSPIKYLEGKTFHEVNKCAESGTIQAHSSAKVPIIKISMDEINAEHIGYLFYFFCLSCAISGMLIDVNPFDQPGVEAYKSNMKKLLLSKSN